MDIEKIVIVDFGSQYTQLIARRVREANVYSEIIGPNDSIDDNHIGGIILSGGPNRILPDVPILGICYGMQLISYKHKGRVDKSDKREYGKAQMQIVAENPLFDDIPENSTVWMSHSDKVVQLPEHYTSIAVSGNTENAAIVSDNGRIFGIQFHPEVIHTEYGFNIISNFLYKICGMQGNWNPENFIESTVEQIRNAAPKGTVIAGISGGVDSTVASELVHRAVGDRLKGFMIDTGLMRLNECAETVELLKGSLHMDIELIDSSELFMERLEHVSEPEQKRKIIGKAFIEVFEEAAGSTDNAEYLVQGTIYPDRIESSSTKGPSSTIKSHHNVGGLPENMKLKLIEPLKDLFKDEVRKVGFALGIPEALLMRHPFPGPGLAVRIIGEIDRTRTDILQHADAVFIDTIKKHNLYDDIWQAFAVFLPVRSVGVMGDNRTYENVIALRAVTSVDGMTADWFDFPKEVLHEVSTRIINEIKGVNRVVYDVSTKPPSTIEWE